MSIVICDKSYDLTKEPRHGVVRRIRKERQMSLRSFLEMFQGEVDFNGDIETELKKVMTSHPKEAMEFGYSEIDFRERATISLALNHYFEEEDFDDLTEKELDDIRTQCEKHLGGDVDHFLGLSDSKSNQNQNVKTPAKRK